MASTDRNVIDAKVTLMTTTEFENILLGARLDNVNDSTVVFLL